ncbi:unnamed protein product, partial [marine sediment metagenome]
MWQIASDFFIFSGWLLENLGRIVDYAFRPIIYIFTYVKSYFLTALGPPVPADEIW